MTAATRRFNIHVKSDAGQPTMRIDAILMVLGVAVMAAGTFFVLETTVETPGPQLSPVTPQEPPVVEESEA